MEPMQNASGEILSARRRILVADDEATLRMGINYTLAGDNTSVDLAEDGNQALQVLASEEYDLLILDLRMPGVDGITVIEALRVSGNRVPVILCSAEFTPGTFLRAVRCDVVDFLLKPANPAQIRSAVEFVLEPTPDALSQAMKSAREGDTAAAIRILESAPAPNAVSEGWLKVLRSIDDGETDSAEAITEDEFTALVLNADADV